MATDMITLKLEDKFLEEIDKIVKSEAYKNRTEFIRTALREKVDQNKLKKTMEELSKLRGSLKHHHTTDEDLEWMREAGLKKLEQQLK
ncbi:MAG: ribbon-helix-helix domain-containing protein [Candidatus Woesearchaeota archaeon]